MLLDLVENRPSASSDHLEYETTFFIGALSTETTASITVINMVACTYTLSLKAARISTSKELVEGYGNAVPRTDPGLIKTTSMGWVRWGRNER